MSLLFLPELISVRQFLIDPCLFLINIDVRHVSTSRSWNARTLERPADRPRLVPDKLRQKSK